MLLNNILNIVTLLICLQQLLVQKIELMKPQNWSNCVKIEHLVAWESMVGFN